MMINRNYGIDLLRIIATLFVLLLHIISQGQVNYLCEMLSIRYEVLVFLEVMCTCCINCYGLISGYVGIDSKHNARSIINLYFEVLFYSIVIALIMFFAVPSSLGDTSVFKYFFPLLNDNYWYFTCYFVLFLLMPLLNFAINNVDKKVIERTIIVLFTFLSVIPCISQNKYAFSAGGGFSIMWLLFLYVVGAYVKKYDLKLFKKKRTYLIAFFCLILFWWIIKFLQEYFTHGVYFTLKVCNYPTIFLQGLCLLLYFKDFSPKGILIKLTKVLSPMTFGVYLIHVHPVFFEYMKGCFVNWVYMPFIQLFLCLFVVWIGVYLLASLIDFIRIQLFKLIRINKLSVLIESKINILFNK